MDYLKNFTNDAHSEGRATSEEQPTKENKAESSADDRTKEQSGGWNLGDKLNSALGGGKESEAKEGECEVRPRSAVSFCIPCSQKPSVIPTDYLDKGYGRRRDMASRDWMRSCTLGPQLTLWKPHQR